MDSPSPHQATALDSWSQRRSFAVIVMMAGMVSVQVGAAVAKRLLPVFGPYPMVMFRLGIAACILCAVRRPWRYTLTTPQRRAILMYGTALGAMNLSFYLALARIPLGIAVGLEYFGPLAVALLGSRRMYDLAWIALALCGFLCLVPHTELGTTLDPWGIFFAVLSGALSAVYIILGQRAGANLPSGVTSSLGVLIAAGVVLPICGWHMSHVGFTVSLSALVITVAVLSSVIPYPLEMVALQRMPAKTFGILLSLGPAIAAIAGFVFLRERLLVVQWLGILCVIAASIGSVGMIRAPVIVTAPNYTIQ